MSMPNIPNMTPSISVDRNDALNIILSSIGMEELSLAHIVNAEAEKIQFALGTLDTASGAASLEDIMAVNSSAKRMLRDVIKNQMLIGMKMEDTVDLALHLEETATTQPEPEPEAEETKAESEPVADTEAEPAPEAESAAPEEEPVVEEEPAPEEA